MIFVDQVTSDISDYDNILFISLGYIYHNRVEDLQNFLDNKDINNGSQMQHLTGLIEYPLDPLLCK